jgi:hypothetical protein
MAFRASSLELMGASTRVWYRTPARGGEDLLPSCAAVARWQDRFEPGHWYTTRTGRYSQLRTQIRHYGLVSLQC